MVSPCLRETLASALSHCLDADPNVRMTAEMSIKNLAATHENCPLVLLQLVIAPELDVALRQISFLNYLFYCFPYMLHGSHCAP